MYFLAIGIKCMMPDIAKEPINTIDVITGVAIAELNYNVLSPCFVN